MAAKPKAVVIIGIASLVVAAFASYSLYSYLKGQETKVKSAVATSGVVVAALEIPAGSAINLTQLKTVNWPQSDLPKGFYTSADQVASRVSMDKIAPGEPVLESKLVPKDGQSGILTYKIPEGHRAMTVGVDPVSGVAGFIMPGNRVDVVLTTSQMSGQQQPVSKIVLQNVPVLAIGQVVEQQKDGKPLAVPTVTMDVVPNDAERLAIASTQGKLQLVLRRAGDADIAKTSGETVVKVIGMSSSASAPRTSSKEKPAPKTPKMSKDSKTEKPAVKPAEKPAEKPVDMMNVDVWRGSHKSTEHFKTEKQQEMTK
ncbi:MAG: Flp pilus assembly protein CpaB [Nitrospirae bacterium]|nr:Flp pilus assembly protein CpaB [Nitrospirota bacterium]